MNKGKLEEKIAQLANGDGRAFDYIYEHTNRPVYFAILYIVRDKMYAEDILQETYVRALRSLHTYSPGTNFSAWLARIGKNLALNHIKREKREVATDFEENTHLYGAQETHPPYIFDLAVKVLSEEEYEILMLCQVSGYKRREVAQILNMPVATVTWKNNEALKKLRRTLQKEEAI